MVPPHAWQPHSGPLVINETAGRGLEVVVPCMALSTDGSYILSTSGGEVSLFSLGTFKVRNCSVPKG